MKVRFSRDNSIMSDEHDLGQTAIELAYAFPDFLGLATGIDGTNPVPDEVALNEKVLGFLNGFGRTLIRIASVRLNIDAEFHGVITYRAIANVMNRFGELSTFEQAIEHQLRDPSDGFLMYQDIGMQYLRATTTGGNQTAVDQILKMMRQDVTELLDASGLNPIPKH